MIQLSILTDIVSVYMIGLFLSIDLITVCALNGTNMYEKIIIQKELKAGDECTRKKQKEREARERGRKMPKDYTIEERKYMCLNCPSSEAGQFGYQGY